MWGRAPRPVPRNEASEIEEISGTAKPPQSQPGAFVLPFSAPAWLILLHSEHWLGSRSISRRPRRTTHGYNRLLAGDLSVQRDMDIRDLRRKADSGSPVARSILGICYLCGIDVQIDYKEAFQLLASAGTSRAVVNLARMYAEGLGVPKNTPEA